jgi:hypothetical protein
METPNSQISSNFRRNTQEDIGLTYLRLKWLQMAFGLHLIKVHPGLNLWFDGVVMPINFKIERLVGRERSTVERNATPNSRKF